MDVVNLSLVTEMAPMSWNKFKIYKVLEKWTTLVKSRIRPKLKYMGENKEIVGYLSKM